MISVDEKTNNLSISRGDTFTLRINLHGGITLGANDFVRFAVKKTIGSSEIVFTKDVQNPGEQYVDIPFNYEELDQLTDSSYRYDVTLICKDAKKNLHIVLGRRILCKGGSTWHRTRIMRPSM